MIIVPKGQPTIGALNTFYIDLERLIEHCQGEFGAGCIHLRSAQRRAAIYFDRDEIVETAVESAKEATHGASARVSTPSICVGNTIANTSHPTLARYSQRPCLPSALAG